MITLQYIGDRYNKKGGEKHQMVKEQFKERFRGLYDLSGCSSIAEFSRRLDMNRQSVDRYYNGERCPDSSALTQICEKMKVSADWLLGLSDVKSSSSDIKDVCEITGLSEKAVEKITAVKPYRDTKGLLPTIDYNEADGKLTKEGIEKQKKKKPHYSMMVSTLSKLIETERFSGLIIAYKRFLDSATKLKESTLQTPDNRLNDLETVVLSRDEATRYYMQRVIDEITIICDDEYKKNYQIAMVNEQKRIIEEAEKEDDIESGDD